MTLKDIIRTWLAEDPELKHFVLEHSDVEDFDADWITCPCSSHILATIKERSVLAMTAPLDTTLEKTRVRLPLWFDVPISHPLFFEMLKYSLLKYHTTYL